MGRIPNQDQGPGQGLGYQPRKGTSQGIGHQTKGSAKSKGRDTKPQESGQIKKQKHQTHEEDQVKDRVTKPLRRIQSRTSRTGSPNP